MGKIIVVGDEWFANKLKLRLNGTGVEVLHTPGPSENLQREFVRGNLVFVSTLMETEEVFQVGDDAQRAGFHDLVYLRAGDWTEEQMDRPTRSGCVWIERDLQLAELLFKVVQFMQSLTPEEGRVLRAAAGTVDRCPASEAEGESPDDAWTDHLIETAESQV